MNNKNLELNQLMEASLLEGFGLVEENNGDLKRGNFLDNS